MASLNSCSFIGNLGADPETRDAGGKTVVELSIAANESWTDKAGQKQERTEWIRAVLWERQAEVAAKYLRKGSLVYVEGSLRTEKYVDSSTGQDRYSTKVIVRRMQFLDRKEGGGQAGGAPAAAPAQGGEFDDAIPF